MKRLGSHIRFLLSVVSVVSLCSLGYGQLVPNLGGQRAGISAFQFLKLGVGGRGVAMGESFVAVANDASALYWNPAGLVQFTDNQAIASHTEQYRCPVAETTMSVRRLRARVDEDGYTQRPAS